MKTLFDKMMLQFEWLSYPAGGWLQITATPKKTKRRRSSVAVLSPECSNVRGGRNADARKTPAP
ncbi:MAG TPA: hypothetical protein VM888_01015 [Chitinophagaceae bacterium]|nr:hypothetical protein [Chitinophagaceae bacterium]